MKAAQSPDEFPDTFLPRRVARAADAAMENVLLEDEVRRLLHTAGVTTIKRSRSVSS